jgi:hypothetical protein
MFIFSLFHGEQGWNILQKNRLRVESLCYVKEEFREKIKWILSVLSDYICLRKSLTGRTSSNNIDVVGIKPVGSNTISYFFGSVEILKK